MPQRLLDLFKVGYRPFGHVEQVQRVPPLVGRNLLHLVTGEEVPPDPDEGIVFGRLSALRRENVFERRDIDPRRQVERQDAAPSSKFFERQRRGTLHRDAIAAAPAPRLDVEIGRFRRDPEI